MHDVKNGGGIVKGTQTSLYISLQLPGLCNYFEINPHIQHAHGLNLFYERLTLYEHYGQKCLKSHLMEKGVKF